MFSNLRKYRVLPLLKCKEIEPESAIKIAEALMTAGLPAMEINFRRHSDSKAIKEIARIFPNFLIGASGILNKDQLLRAIDSGAKFITSPVLCRDCLAVATKQKITFAPGANTPNEIEEALLSGCITFQFFPAYGAKYLKAVLEPFEHLPLDVVVKGGLTCQDAQEYSQVQQVLAVSVEDIIRPEYVAEQNWQKITETAAAALSGNTTN